MIVFDLECHCGHAFEGWFANSLAYENQRSRGLLNCPVCGKSKVGKRVMSPRISSGASIDQDDQRAVLAKLAALQRTLLDGSQWVGRDLANRARAMSDGVEPLATIHGQATPAEAAALRDDGVPLLPLIFPVVPPEQVN